MTISVVVPVRDGAAFLDEALASVAAQTRLPDEVIVVDDGSRDASAAIAERHGARVERLPPSGAPAARNRGVEAASGDLVAFLDADDLWPPGKLERQERVLLDAGVDLLFGHVRQFGAAGVEHAAEPVPALLFGTLVARRATFARVGPLDAQLRVGDLMEWLFRAREAGARELMDGEVALLRRLHPTSLSRIEDARLDHVRVVRQALARRRAG